MRRVCGSLFVLAAAVGVQAGAGQPAGKADPEATKLLADARTARATWEKFPGFRADVEVNTNGKISKGRVEVNAKGEVQVELAEKEVKGWVRGQLQSLVEHRLPADAERNTPCAFADDNADHPLGRAVRLLQGESHASYRIRHRQIIEVNRQTGDVRFTITVLDNQLTEEKKFLPISYVVNRWKIDPGATNQGRLQSSAAHHHVWKRIEGFDAPQSLTILTATDGFSLDARTLRFSNLKLAR